MLLKVFHFFLQHPMSTTDRPQLMLVIFHLCAQNISTGHDHTLDEIFRREKLDDPDCKEIEKEAQKRMGQRLLKWNKKRTNKTAQILISPIAAWWAVAYFTNVGPAAYEH